jgi:AbrB family looped-hinge helix DNA binding protein
VLGRGRITIPKAVRQALGVSAGDRVMFVELGPGHCELVAVVEPVSALKGMVRKPAAPVSLDEMDAAIAERGSKCE